MFANKRVLSVVAAPLLLAAGSTAHAQVHQSVTGSLRHLWGGAEYSSFHTDFNPGAGRLSGIGVFGDYSITNRIGLEATARFLTFDPPARQTQKDYLIGPTVVAYQRGKLYLNGVFQLGGVFIQYPAPVGQDQSSGSYFAFVPGGNVEYRISPKFRIRGGYEIQFLPSAPGEAISYPRSSSGLTPTGFSIGVSYRIF